MTVSQPTTLESMLASMGAAGQRLNQLSAIEAGAGNLSVCFNWQADISRYFPDSREIDLPWPVPNLVGYTLLVTGTGCRLREVADDPVANVGAVTVYGDGIRGTLHYQQNGAFTAPTSEFNSHLAVHDDQILRRGVTFHALIHAQPQHLVQLSHIEDYASTDALNQAILGWEPETIVQLPEGVVFLPFMVPGSQELMENNVRGLRDHQITIWAQHGLMARSDISPLAACDKIEYAETGATYEYRNLLLGGRGKRLTADQLHRVVQAFGINTNLY
jgi:rhamnulose-1-phosphate aldolase